jgi:hypothetical protein
MLPWITRKLSVRHSGSNRAVRLLTQKASCLKNEEPVYPDNLQYLTRVGNSLSQLYGLIAERLFIDDKDVANSPVQGFGDYKAGDIKYRDMNGDGKISSSDVVPIGYPTGT